ncbi:MAG: hypothetical protein JSV09_10690, partial [Thermoplasmata archaeon]
MKIQKITVTLLTLLIMSFCGSGNIMADDPPDTCPTLPEALEALESDSAVTVKTVQVEEWEEGSDFYFAFEPKNTSPSVGFIIYPGAYVDPRAYAPPAHTIAAKGYLTVIVKMRNNLAIGKTAQRASKIISDYGEIKKWVIGGHSMGGAASCYYAKNFTDNVDGVILWAAYPTDIWRIDDKDLKAISIYGTKNPNLEEFEASEEHLPPNTLFVIIEGGNHSQFGWYDASLCPEEMDNTPADITIEEQQGQIIRATVDFLKQFDEIIPPALCTAKDIYGEHSEETELLRHLRDSVLKHTPEG